MLSIIQKNPGIRASEINREMKIEHTWNLRSTLIQRGLVRKEKKAAAVHYYVIQTQESRYLHMPLIEKIIQMPRNMRMPSDRSTLCASAAPADARR